MPNIVVLPFDEKRDDDVGEKIAFKRRLPLDGLRGILSLLVVGFHMNMSFLSQGYSGVDGFFVLSGFVISSILLYERKTTDVIDYFRFYARRAKRLLPASLLVVLVSTIAYRFIVSDMLLSENRKSLLTANVFSENIYLIINSNDYFGDNTEDSPVMHYWSLAVEEQFYFVFPWAFSLFLTFTKFNTKIGSGLLTVLIGLLIFYSWYASQTLSKSSIYFGTQFRVYQLLSGTVLSMIFFHFQTQKSKSKDLQLPNQSTPQGAAAIISGNILSMIGFVGVLVISTSLFPMSSLMVGYLSTLFSILMIIGLEIYEDSIIGKVLSTRVFQFLGKHSYAIYLWHYPIIIMMRLRSYRTYEDGTMHSPLEVLFVIIVISFLTWVLVEKPAKNIKLSNKKIVMLGVFCVILSFSSVYLITTVGVEEPEEYWDNYEDIVLEVDDSPVDYAPPLVAPVNPVPISDVYGDTGDPTRTPREAEYVLFGDQYAGEWRNIPNKIRNSLGVPFTLKWDGACNWVSNNIEYSWKPDLTALACNSWRNSLPSLVNTHIDGTPKVVFLESGSTINSRYSSSPYTEGIMELDHPMWGNYTEQLMREFLDPYVLQRTGIYFVIIAPHYGQPKELKQCISLNPHDLPSCSHFLASTSANGLIVDEICKRLDIEYGDKVEYIEINDIFGDFDGTNYYFNATTPIGNDPHVYMWKQTGQLAFYYLENVHIYSRFVEKLRPFVHNYLPARPEEISGPSPSPTPSSTVTPSVSPFATHSTTPTVNPMLPVSTREPEEATYLLYGDSFAGEWMLAVNKIQNAIEAPFRLEWKSSCAWFNPPTHFGNMNRKASCDKQDELFNELMNDTSKPRVVFMETFTPMELDYMGVKRNSPHWEEYTEGLIREWLEPFIYDKTGIYFVIIDGHYPQPWGLRECLKVNQKKDCNGFKAVPFHEVGHALDRIYKRLDVDYANRVEYIQINDLIGDFDGNNYIFNATTWDTHEWIWKDLYHMNYNYCNNHFMRFVEKMRPFVHLYQN